MLESNTNDWLVTVTAHEIRTTRRVLEKNLVESPEEDLVIVLAKVLPKEVRKSGLKVMASVVAKMVKNIKAGPLNQWESNQASVKAAIKFINSDEGKLWSKCREVCVRQQGN